MKTHKQANQELRKLFLIKDSNNYDFELCGRIVKEIFDLKNDFLKNFLIRENEFIGSAILLNYKYFYIKNKDMQKIIDAYPKFKKLQAFT